MAETRRSKAPPASSAQGGGSRSRSKTPVKSAPSEKSKSPVSDVKKKNEEDKEKPISNHHHNVVEYEFGGPIGAFFVIFGLPVVIYALYFFCNKEVCLQSPFAFPWQRFLGTLPTHASELFSWEAAHIYGFWMGLQLFLERVLPGEVVEGSALPDGKRLKYTMSGHLQFWISIILMGHAIPSFLHDIRSGVWSLAGLSPLPLHLLYDHYVQLITISCIGAFVLSVYLYASSFLPGRQLARGGNTGNHVYDFFIGRELNPRIGSLDLKEFCELRPGLIGWAILNLGM